MYSRFLIEFGKGILTILRKSECYLDRRVLPQHLLTLFWNTFLLERFLERFFGKLFWNTIKMHCGGTFLQRLRS